MIILDWIGQNWNLPDIGIPGSWIQMLVVLSPDDNYCWVREKKYCLPKPNNVIDAPRET